MTDNQNMNKTIDNLVPTRSAFVLETKLFFFIVSLVAHFNSKNNVCKQ